MGKNTPTKKKPHLYNKSTKHKKFLISFTYNVFQFNASKLFYFISLQYNSHYHPSLVVKNEKIIVFKNNQERLEEGVTCLC